MIYYFINEGDKERGPYTLKELKNTSLNKDTLIWYAGIDQWSKASSIFELNDLFEKKLSLHGFAKNKLRKIFGIKIIKASLKKVS